MPPKWKIPRNVIALAVPHRISVRRDYHGVFTVWKAGHPYGQRHAQSTGGALRLVRDLIRNPHATNPRGGKFDRCVAEVKRRGGAYNPFAVCASRLKPRRRRNPRMASYIITAQKPGGRVLRYIGHRKFAERGRAVLFANETSARSVLGLLRLEFPALRSYTMRVHGGR